MPTEPLPSGTFDVAIAGAGLAGGALALRLARGDARVALLDAAAFPRDKLCGEYLSPESWSVLDRMDLADEVARSGYHPIRRVRITTPRGRIVETEVAGPDGLPGIGLSRSVLDDLIVHRARAAGAEVFERARASGPIIADGRVVGLSARHPNLGAFEVRASVTIAANGRFSTLVRQTGRTRVRNRFRTRYFGLKRHLTVADGDATEPRGHGRPPPGAGRLWRDLPHRRRTHEFLRPVARIGRPPPPWQPRSGRPRQPRPQPGAGPARRVGRPGGRLEDRRGRACRGLDAPASPASSTPATARGPSIRSEVRE